MWGGIEELVPKFIHSLWFLGWNLIYNIHLFSVCLTQWQEHRHQSHVYILSLGRSKDLSEPICHLFRRIGRLS